MSVNADIAAQAYGPARGRVKGDLTTTTTVKYLDCSAMADGCWYSLIAIDQPLWILWVESVTPATTPDPASVAANACMYQVPAGLPFERRIPRTNKVLAYRTVSGTGQLRIVFDGAGDQRK